MVSAAAGRRRPCRPRGRPRTATASRAPRSRRPGRSCSRSRAHEPPSREVRQAGGGADRIRVADAERRRCTGRTAGRRTSPARPPARSCTRRPTGCPRRPRNWPPPQMHAICGLHSLGHQHASVRRRAAIARRHAFARAKLSARSAVARGSGHQRRRLPLMLPRAEQTSIAAAEARTRSFAVRHGGVKPAIRVPLRNRAAITGVYNAWTRRASENLSVTGRQRLLAPLRRRASRYSTAMRTATPRAT